MKETELLKVLDMSEDEQIGFIYKYKGISSYCAALAINKRWGDLAFRLRDEALDFADGAEILHKHLFPSHSQKSRKEHTIGWLCTFGEPIHFIIAALIAKENK